MKQNFHKLLIAAAALVALLGLNSHPSIAGASGTFSNESLRGGYGCRSRNPGFINSLPGTVNLPGINIAELERLEFDGAGHLTGTQIANAIFGQLLNTICHYSLTGTYSVRADGTGTIQATQTLQPGSDCEHYGLAATTQNQILLVGPTSAHLRIVDSSAITFECTPQR
jgi:hypothetical protein